MTTNLSKDLKIRLIGIQSKEGASRNDIEQLIIDALLSKETLHKNTKNVPRAIRGFTARMPYIVLLPELATVPYCYTKDIWKLAEEDGGNTVIWMSKLAKKYGVYLGMSYLRKLPGSHYANEFVFMNPDGIEIKGANNKRVTKQKSAAFESFFLKGIKGARVLTINTPCGPVKIGVGICYENQRSFIFKEFWEEKVDLILMPHCAPTPQRGILATEKQVEDYDKALKLVATFNSIFFSDVPILMVNKVGEWKSPLAGILKFVKQDSVFKGFSAIALNYNTLQQLVEEEGYIAETLILKAEKERKLGTFGFGFLELKSMPFAWPLLQFYAIQAMGGISYFLSIKRRLAS